MFVIDRNREVVGFSRWPWGSLYEPFVGCFHNGRLVSRAIANQAYQLVGLDGPLERWWFRMALEPEVRLLLEQGDPSVVILRLEDAEVIPPARPTPYERIRPLRFEEFLSYTSSHRHDDLTGFGTFLEAPLSHQLDVLYLDLFGRDVDPPARLALSERLNEGESILSIRSQLFLSEELMLRGVRPSTRVGSLTTSALWKVLRAVDPLGERWSRLPSIRLSEYEDQSTFDFVRRFFQLCMARTAEPETHRRLVELADEHGRAFMASITVRDAATTGAFFDLQD